MRKGLYLMVGLLGISLMLSGCKKDVKVDQLAAPKSGETVAEISVKNFGIIKVKFFKEAAPKAVENFITHAKEGYYDGGSFHRIIDNFMIQGGDPTGTGRGGESIWGKPFEDEFTRYLIPIRGALCMANAGEDTNGSQFFIVQETDYQDENVKALKDKNVPNNLIQYYKKNGGSCWLYRQHTVFGQVFEGMDVVDQIAAVEADDEGNPDKPVIIDSIKITEYSE